MSDQDLTDFYRRPWTHATRPMDHVDFEALGRALAEPLLADSDRHRYAIEVCRELHDEARLLRERLAAVERERDELLWLLPPGLE